jgi:hypothetical protein
MCFVDLKLATIRLKKLGALRPISPSYACRKDKAIPILITHNFADTLNPYY